MLEQKLAKNMYLTGTQPQQEDREAADKVGSCNAVDPQIWPNVFGWLSVV